MIDCLVFTLGFNFVCYMIGIWFRFGSGRFWFVVVMVGGWWLVVIEIGCCYVEFVRISLRVWIIL